MFNNHFATAAHASLGSFPALPAHHTKDARPHSHRCLCGRVLAGDRLHTCLFEGCGKRFTEPRSLTGHLRAHTDAQPFTYVGVLERRDKGFRSLSNLSCHIRTHTGDRMHVRLLAVIFCVDSFTCAPTLVNGHLRACLRAATKHSLHHPTCLATCAPIRANGHMLGIESSTKTFPEPSQLSRYMRTHTGDRSYVCLFEGGDKVFSHSNSLSRHMRAYIASSSLPESLEWMTVFAPLLCFVARASLDCSHCPSGTRTGSCTVSGCSSPQMLANNTAMVSAGSGGDISISATITYINPTISTIHFSWFGRVLEFTSYHTFAYHAMSRHIIAFQYHATL